MKPVTSWEKVPVIFDLPYAACLLGMNADYLKQLSHDGKFPAFKSGNSWRVNKTDFLAWIENQKASKP